MVNTSNAKVVLLGASGQPPLSPHINEFRRRREFGEYVARLRKGDPREVERGFRKDFPQDHDQKWLAEALDVSPAFISHIESGKALLPDRLIGPFISVLRITDTRQFGWRLLYAQHTYLFDALHSTVTNIWEINDSELPSFVELYKLGDLSAQKKDRPLVVLGDFLRLKRQSLGEDYTQSRTAKLIGYRHRTALANIEAGWAKITGEYFSGWCRALDIPQNKFAAMLLYFYTPILFDLVSSPISTGTSIFDKEELEMLPFVAAAVINPGATRNIKVETQSGEEGLGFAEISIEVLGGNVVTLNITKSSAEKGARYTLRDTAGNEPVAAESIEVLIDKLASPGRTSALSATNSTKMSAKTPYQQWRDTLGPGQARGAPQTKNG
jgi:hypothetical protein